MSRSLKTYLGTVAVLALSILFFYILPHGELIQQLAALPGIGALLAALLQILRDQSAHERSLSLFAAEKLYLIGASSHMANVAFDKHVEFSEEYMREVHETLLTLAREGPTAKALEHARSLNLLKSKFSVWLTKNIEADLGLFEAALRKLGAGAHFVSVSPDAPNRQEWINTMYKTFADLMGKEHMGSSEWEGEELTEEIAVSAVIRRLRQVLGTEELSAIRETIVSRAMRELR